MPTASPTGLVGQLLRDAEPSIRFKLAAGVLGLDPESPEALPLRREVAGSARVAGLLSGRTLQGAIPLHPYQKWRGAHWVLALLADLGYPPCDESLLPLREQVLEWLLGRQHLSSVKTIAGLTRRCASQEGNALYALLILGLADERAARLAGNLIDWQWPDGGWNCDPHPTAGVSSFHETLIPLRALAHYARKSGCPCARAAVERAAEVFLRRRMFRRFSTGAVIDESFLKLRYPCYWHYDLLFGLKVIDEAGFLSDPRCSEALDVLESKRLPSGGFAAEGRHYRVTTASASGASPVDWGPSSSRQINPFVSADALTVLHHAGRMALPSGPAPES